MEKISVFTTGGTIDKVYDKITGNLSFTESFIPSILKKGNFTTLFEIFNLMQVDSLDMTAKERTTIVNNCINSKNSKIIITHGTDTMVETATEIAKENLSKTIVITGAMIPYSIIDSDSELNIGAAISYVQTLKTGVYIAMNGQYFEWNNVEKDKQKGVFQKILS